MSDIRANYIRARDDWGEYSIRWRVGNNGDLYIECDTIYGYVTVLSCHRPTDYNHNIHLRIKRINDHDVNENHNNNRTIYSSYSLDDNKDLKDNNKYLKDNNKYLKDNNKDLKVRRPKLFRQPSEPTKIGYERISKHFSEFEDFFDFEYFHSFDDLPQLLRIIEYNTDKKEEIPDVSNLILFPSLVGASDVKSEGAVKKVKAVKATRIKVKTCSKGGKTGSKDVKPVKNVKPVKAIKSSTNRFGIFDSDNESDDESDY
jgi:hypothetical protein